VAYFYALFWYLDGGTDENLEINQSKYPVSRPIFEITASRTRNKMLLAVPKIDFSISAGSQNEREVLRTSVAQ
jgi:hypothetical protein